MHAQQDQRRPSEAIMADRAPRSPPVFRTSSSHSGVVEAPTSRPAESAVREVRKHLLVRIRLRHSAGQVTLAPPFVAVEELVQRLPQLPVQPRRLVRCVGKISSKITADTPRRATLQELQLPLRMERRLDEQHADA